MSASMITITLDISIRTSHTPTPHSMPPLELGKVLCWKRWGRREKKEKKEEKGGWALCAFKAVLKMWSCHYYRVE
uniref:Uncharacterized protein n=1 Tax=Physcomitrium patens TaxID=3218 RepID=A0A2K1KWH7_PHYPA|nr:hypothetical protein PHYPA_005140 [Physcomitrium patens]